MNNHENTEQMKQGARDPVTEETLAKSSDSFIKNVALFFASPFIALAYAAALPFVGFYQFTKLGHETRVRREKKARKQASKRRKRAS